MISILIISYDYHNHSYHILFSIQNNPFYPPLVIYPNSKIPNIHGSQISSFFFSLPRNFEAFSIVALRSGGLPDVAGGRLRLF